MKKILIALICLSAFILLTACASETPTPVPPTPLAATDTPAPTTAPPTATLAPQASGICTQGSLPAYITKVVLAKDTQGENFEPVDVTDAFEPTQATFHAIVTLQDAPKNLQLGSKWYLVQAEGYKPNTKIDENTLSVDQGGSRNVDFTLKAAQDRWPAGTYCVEIYADGNLALAKMFTVVDNKQPSGAGADVVKAIVLAEDTKPDTFEPVNPTTTFKPNAPFIHAAVQIEKAPANTKFRARWHPPSQDPLDFDLTTDGTRWLDFRLTPTPDGFPKGAYTVEIYVNDELVDTKTFQVE